MSLATRFEELSKTFSLIAATESRGDVAMLCSRAAELFSLAAGEPTGGGTGTVETIAGDPPIQVGGTATDPIVGLNTPLMPNYGGTGLDSYAIGDLLYADAVATLAKLGVGANGQRLTVVAGLPAWADDPALAASLPGITLSKQDGALVGDGVTDDRNAFNTLVNTTLQPNGGQIYMEPSVYRIATAMTVPEDITLWFPRNARIKVDGVILAFLGAIDANLTWIFECVNGGKVEFFNVGSWQSVAALVEHSPVEWFGAKGDFTNIDSDAIDAAIASRRGYPQTPLSTPSWARGDVLLRPGGSYRINRPIKILEASIGGALIGGGAANCQLIYQNSTSITKYTATAYPATNQITLASQPAGNLVGKWLLPAGPTHIGSEAGTSGREIVEDMGGGTLRTNGNHGWTDTSNQFYVLDPCILDISGAFDLRTNGFSVTTEGGLAGSATYSGVFYHRDARLTARGSSRGGFSDILCEAKTHYANFAIGSFIPGQQNHQEDMASFWHCRAFGLKTQMTAGSDNEKLWSRRGWRFGSGLFANPLNYTATACVSVGFFVGVAIAATNVTWDGGTVQTNHWDYDINNGMQASVTIRGPRTEGSEGLLRTNSSQSVFFSIQIEHIEFRGEHLERIAGTGYCKFMELNMPGSLAFNNVRVMAVNQLAGGPNTQITGVGPNYIDTGLTLIADEYKGAILDIHGPGQAPDRGTYEVVSNTAGGRMFLDTDDFATDDSRGHYVPVLTDCYTIRMQPVIEVNDAKSMYITARDVGWPGRPLERCIFLRDQIPTPFTANPNVTYEGDKVIPLNVSGAPAKGYFSSRGSVRQQNVTRITPLNHGDRSDALQGSGIKPFYHYRGEYQKARVVGAYTITIGGLTAGGVYVPNPHIGQKLLVELVQDGIGNHVITWQFGAQAPVKWESGAPPDGGPNSITLVDFFFDGTYWLGSWKQWT